MPSDPKKELLELDDPSTPVEDDEGAGVASGVSPPPSKRGAETLIPSFDPVALAEQAEIRHRAVTLTNEVELERARVASMAKSQPPDVGGRQGSLVELEVEETEMDGLDQDQQVALLMERLSPLHRVPELTRPLAELGERLEDPKVAYVAGFVDGLLPLETILDVTGLPTLDTLRVLDRMIAQGIVTLRASRP